MTVSAVLDAAGRRCSGLQSSTRKLVAEFRASRSDVFTVLSRRRRRGTLVPSTTKRRARREEAGGGDVGRRADAPDRNVRDHVLDELQPLEGLVGGRATPMLLE